MRSVMLTVILAALATGAVFGDCKTLHQYDRIVLFGNSDDPAVLLWDDRLHMRDYESGSFDEMNTLLPHARLLPPGTRAIVQLCVPNFVEPSYMKSPTDAVGIIVVTGPLRGRYGWIVATDIRLVIHTVPKRGPLPVSP